MNHVAIGLAAAVSAGISLGAWAGTIAVNFDDGTPGPLTVNSNWFGTASVGFENGEAHFRATNPIGFQGAQLVYIPPAPLTGDFTVEMTFTTNVSTLVSLTSPMLSGILLPVGWTSSGGQAVPNNVNRAAYCGPTYNAAASTGASSFPLTPVTNAVVSGGFTIREPVREAVPGGIARMSVRVERVGSTLTLLAAYGADARTPTQPGTFHQVTTVTNLTTTGNAGVGYMAFHVVTADAGIYDIGVDDIIISGAEIPDYPGLADSAGPIGSPGEERIARGLGVMLQQHPAADTNGDGNLTVEEALVYQAQRDATLQQSLGAANALNNLPAGMLVDRDVVYGVGPYSSLQKLDILYHADQSEPRPAIVMIHGGGFRVGSKSAFHALMRDYATLGYVTLSISYRFIPQFPFPAQVSDCKQAVRWLRANALTYGVDPDRIGVTGASAGGYLAAMLAVTDSSHGFDVEGGYLAYSSSVLAAVPLCGAYDLRATSLARGYMAEEGWIDFLGAAPSAAPAAAFMASPVAYISPNASPMLLVHSQADPAASVLFTEDFANALKKEGAPVECVLVDGVSHGWPLPFHTEVSPRMKSFFAQYLQP